MQEMSFNEYTQIALIIKQNQELKEKIEKLETDVNFLQKNGNQQWKELTDLSEDLENFKDEIEALRENYSKHIGEY